MKVFKLIVASVFVSAIALAQVPHSVKYQAVIRDLSGSVLANKNVALRIGIIQNSINGNIVYSEQHDCTSNAFGLIDLEIGNGILSAGDFSTINWAAGKFFIKIELDAEGGSNFQLMGTSQLLSVPYALYAEKAANGFSGEYSDLLNKPVTDGSETKVNGGNNISVTGSGTTVNPYVINTVTPHFIGELFGGGVVFYVDKSNQHGLIASLTDLPAEQWSNVYDSVGVAASSPWNGQNNTQAIISQAGHSKSAAKICANYVNPDYGTGVFSDWYLPAVNQLSLLYSNIYEVNKTLDSDNNPSTTTMFYKPYWSSTENWNIFAKGYAYFFNFETFVCDRYSKSNPLVIRAIRNF